MRRLSALLAATLLMTGPALAGPRVVASVVPVQSIVAAVMGDTGTPELLLKGSMSEHRAVFTPAQIAALGDADLVFIVGQGLEAKLAQISGSEAVNGKSFIGWLLTIGGLLFVLLGILMNMDIYFQRTSLLNTILMLGCIAAGFGLVVKSLRPHQKKRNEDGKEDA